MSVAYSLVNYTKKEVISYLHIPAAKARELAGNPVSAAITTWYLLQNRGDRIAFVSDDQGDWPFVEEPQQNTSDYVDVTDQVVESLIEAGIVQDEGIAWADEDEPDSIYIRNLRNIWMEQANIKNGLPKQA